GRRRGSALDPRRTRARDRRRRGGGAPPPRSRPATGAGAPPPPPRRPRAPRVPDGERRPRRLRAVPGGRGRLLPAGRWALLRTPTPNDADPFRFARQLLRRWGVVLREVLARESCMPPWRVPLG